MYTEWILGNSPINTDPSTEAVSCELRTQFPGLNSLDSSPNSATSSVTLHEVLKYIVTLVSSSVE